MRCKNDILNQKENMRGWNYAVAITRGQMDEQIASGLNTLIHTRFYIKIILQEYIGLRKHSLKIHATKVE